MEKKILSSAVFKLLAGVIDRNIEQHLNFRLHSQHSGFKECFFLKLPEGWMFSKIKISDTVNTRM